MWLLFVPVAILLTVLLAVGLLVHGVVAIFGGGWPILLIALGIWMFVREDGRHRRARQWQASTGTSVAFGDWPKQPRSSARTESRPTRVAVQKGPSLPSDVQATVERIRAKAEKLAAAADQFPPFSQDLYLARQTTSDYLPRTLETYLSLPRDSVDRPMVPGGKTPHQELKAQLDLLDSKLDDIARELDRQNHEKLIANRKFLQDRFEMRDEHPEAASDLRAESA